MNPVLQSLRHDHRAMEEVLRVLAQECALLHRAERPDYDLIAETLDWLAAFRAEHLAPRAAAVLRLMRARGADPALLDRIAAEGAAAAGSLQTLAALFGEIRNEQRVLREDFDAAAAGYIAQERRRMALETDALVPAAMAKLAPQDWAELQVALGEARRRPHRGRLEERLEAQHDAILEVARDDRAARRTGAP
ncbi:MAG: hypothetical protein C3F17_16390 [Bradyrhizobiaceae bacterium]|nr:MAG: hypothetical protein C3F17_16390 [Bradyrhizobiaceae bacterium]